MFNQAKKSFKKKISVFERKNKRRKMNIKNRIINKPKDI